MRTNAREESQLKGGGPALSGSFVGVGPAVVLSGSLASSVACDEENGHVSNKGT